MLPLPAQVFFLLLIKDVGESENVFGLIVQKQPEGK